MNVNVYRKVLESLHALQVKVVVEDDYPDFKDFFATWPDAQMMGSFSKVEFVLFEIANGNDSSSAIEFHCFFYTLKGRKRQRMLSSNEFERLKQFLENNVFEPAGLYITEYFSVNRDYRINGKEMLFPDSLPGVIIEVGGELSKDSKRKV